MPGTALKIDQVHPRKVVLIKDKLGLTLTNLDVKYNERKLAIP